VTLPAFAAERRHQGGRDAARRTQISLEISCSHGAQQQTRWPPLLP